MALALKKSHFQSILFSFMNSNSSIIKALNLHSIELNECHCQRNLKEENRKKFRLKMSINTKVCK